MLLTEYDEQAHIESEREIAIEEGREIEIFSSVFEKDYSLERGAEKLNLPKEIFEKRYQAWLEENIK